MTSSLFFIFIYTSLSTLPYLPGFLSGNDNPLAYRSSTRFLSGKPTLHHQSSFTLGLPGPRCLAHPVFPRPFSSLTGINPSFLRNPTGKPLRFPNPRISHCYLWLARSKRPLKSRTKPELRPTSRIAWCRKSSLLSDFRKERRNNTVDSWWQIHFAAFSPWKPCSCTLLYVRVSSPNRLLL